LARMRLSASFHCLRCRYADFHIAPLCALRSAASTLSRLRQIRVCRAAPRSGAICQRVTAEAVCCRASRSDARACALSLCRQPVLMPRFTPWFAAMPPFARRRRRHVYQLLC
jgi:hypothetical protein